MVFPHKIWSIMPQVTMTPPPLAHPCPHPPPRADPHARAHADAVRRELSGLKLGRETTIVDSPANIGAITARVLAKHGSS